MCIRDRANGYRAMQFRILARKCGVNTCALARCANCINSVVVVIADLGHKLRLQNASVAHCEARRQSVSITSQEKYIIVLSLREEIAISLISSMGRLTYVQFLPS